MFPIGMYEYIQHTKDWHDAFHHYVYVSTWSSLQLPALLDLYHPRLCALEQFTSKVSTNPNRRHSPSNRTWFGLCFLHQSYRCRYSLLRSSTPINTLRGENAHAPLWLVQIGSSWNCTPHILESLRLLASRRASYAGKYIRVHMRVCRRIQSH